jgi:hypothetical protein
MHARTPVGPGGRRVAPDGPSTTHHPPPSSFKGVYDIAKHYAFEQARQAMDERMADGLLTDHGTGQ